MSSTLLIDNMIKFVHKFTPLSDNAQLARRGRANIREEDAAVDIQNGVAFEPSYVYTMLKNTSAAGIFSMEGHQEDAKEFLSCLLNGVNDEMFKLIKLVNTDQNETVSVETNTNYNNGEEETLQLETQESEKNCLESNFNEMRREIIKMMNELGISSSTSFEHLVYKDSNNMARLKKLKEKLKHQMETKKNM